MNPREYATMFAAEDGHWWYRGLRAMVAGACRRHLPPGNPRILDAGCGTGATLEMLGQFGAPAGVDLAPLAVQYCRGRGQALTASGSVLDLPFKDAAFDAAVSLDVLCHRAVTDKQAPLREMARVLRPGGLLILNLPAYQWLLSSHDAAVQNDTRFTKRRALALLKQAGFTPIEATYWNSLLLPPIIAARLWRRLLPPAQSDIASGGQGPAGALFRAILAAERALLRLTPLPAGLSVFLVARNARD